MDCSNLGPSSHAPCRLHPMILLPIVGRELRVAARRSGTYHGRSWLALGTLIFAGIVLGIHRMSGGGTTTPAG